MKDKLEKAYEFMKRFVIGRMNLLEKFKKWIGEIVEDVGEREVIKLRIKEDLVNAKI